jgi:hypothetical protein
LLLLKILLGIAAVALGIWLGLPGRYTQSVDEIEKAMERGGARRNTVKRHFTPLDWFRKEQKGSDRRRQRRHFRTAAPEDRGQDGD